jgi:hypothetical protein
MSGPCAEHYPKFLQCVKGVRQRDAHATAHAITLACMDAFKDFHYCTYKKRQFDAMPFDMPTAEEMTAMDRTVLAQQGRDKPRSL